METLDQIGLRYATDKASNRNNFLNFYEPFLTPMRLIPVRVMEIGVLNGASVRMWRDYFPNGEVIGVDNNPDALQHAGERLRIEIADQSKPDDLNRLASLGPFDLVIDDGSHIWNHQIFTFRQLMPAVASSGFYVLEDLDTSYGSYVSAYCGEGGMSAADYLKLVADRVIGRRRLNSVELLDKNILSIAASVDFITLTRGTSLLRKQGRLSRIEHL